jgi:acyl-CoA synthetase (AMP-forming)/AMP-acid ligase II
MEDLMTLSYDKNQLDDNFVQRFIQHSQSHPNKLALHISHMDKTVCTHEERLSYGQLADAIKAYQALWRTKGWRTNDRIIVIIKPSSQLYAIALSLLALGMTPVFIDTGMGREKIKMAIEDSNARAIISMKALLKWFWLIPPMWKLDRLAIDAKGFGYHSLTTQLNAIKLSEKHSEIESIKQSDTDHGLISFTSGSTGRPKGADRTHYSLIQQHLAIRDHWPDSETDIDSPCFPVMVLHNLSCGMTTVMPKVDLAEPAKVDAAQVLQQLQQFNITRLSGAPAYIQALVDYAIKHNEMNASVKTLVVGGATVSVELAKGILVAFPNAYSRIVYGSTEAEPIASIEIKEYLAHCDQQLGYLVGKPAEQIEILIANIPKGTLREDDLLKQAVPYGGVGEILVSGEHVLKQYVDNPSANAENKIQRVAGVQSNQYSVWHRTGDSGFLDGLGRLWLTGRVNDTLSIDGNIIQPYPLEQALDNIEGISRTALICVDDALHLFVETTQQRIQPLSGVMQNKVDNVLTSAGIVDVCVNVIACMPVDGRHNSKIDRVTLRNTLQKTSR